ncbi:MAG: DNA-protecting protein DprA [Actinobacteria bacterium]|nr:DNA-protecting protein DprA [Actinomycetota bacterium]
MNLFESQLVLFAAVEGGSPFWASEVKTFGAQEVIRKAKRQTYDPTKYEKAVARMCTLDPSTLIREIEGAAAIFITKEDPLWPMGLNDLVAPPHGLIVKGNAQALTTQSLAIVGTRNPTNYGVRIAGEFAAGFADRDWTIISGGAYGIDAAAHRGALIAEGVSIAVLACGINVNYPAGHARLFAELCESGALISEVMPTVSAIPARFLTRNRLIAAISRSTLVVEAAFRSGSLRTARDAAEIFRPVMAIPGPITSPTSEGCHRLIGERAAEIVTSVTDAVEFISTFK